MGTVCSALSDLHPPPVPALGVLRVIHRIRAAVRGQRNACNHGEQGIFSAEGIRKKRPWGEQRKPERATAAAAEWRTSRREEHHRYGGPG